MIIALRPAQHRHELIEVLLVPRVPGVLVVIPVMVAVLGRVLEPLVRLNPQVIPRAVLDDPRRVVLRVRGVGRPVQHVLEVHDLDPRMVRRPADRLLILPLVVVLDRMPRHRVEALARQRLPIVENQRELRLVGLHRLVDQRVPRVERHPAVVRPELRLVLAVVDREAVHAVDPVHLVQPRRVEAAVVPAPRIARIKPPVQVRHLVDVRRGVRARRNIVERVPIERRQAGRFRTNHPLRRVHHPHVRRRQPENVLHQLVEPRDARRVHRPLEVRHDVLGEHAADERPRLAVVLVVVHELRDPGQERRSVGPRVVAGCGLGPFRRRDQRPAHMDVQRHIEDLVRLQCADEPRLVGRRRVVQVYAQRLGLVERLVAVGDGRVLGTPDVCVRRDRPVNHAVGVSAVVVEERVRRVALAAVADLAGPEVRAVLGRHDREIHDPAAVPPVIEQRLLGDAKLHGVKLAVEVRPQEPADGLPARVDDVVIDAVVELDADLPRVIDLHVGPVGHPRLPAGGTVDRDVDVEVAVLGVELEIVQIDAEVDVVALDPRVERDQVARIVVPVVEVVPPPGVQARPVQRPAIVPRPVLELLVVGVPGGVRPDPRPRPNRDPGRRDRDAEKSDDNPHEARERAHPSNSLCGALSKNA